MILDNLTRALKTQNWLAAGVEFIIVIAGVVIGFQINAWNEGRQDQAIEARYLQQIGIDLAYDLDRVDYFIAFYRSQADAAQRIIEYHESSLEIDPARYHADVIEVLFFEEHTPRYSSLDALLASGDSALMSDERIFNQLLEINLRYEEVAKLQAHKHEDVREFLYARYGDTLDYQRAIEAFQGTVPEGLDTEVIEQSREDLRIKNGLIAVSFNNGLLIDHLQAIKRRIEETQLLLRSQDR